MAGAVMWDDERQEPAIEEPRTLGDSIGEDAVAARWSLAAGIVTLGLHLNDDRALIDELDDDERRFAQQLEVPPLRQGFSFDDAFDELERFGLGVPLSELFERRRLADDPALLEAQSRVLRNVQDESNPDRHQAATAFTLLNLIHDDELVRVAAAASATTTFERTPRAAEFLIPILAEGCQSRVETVRQLAANALERLDPRHPTLEELSGEDEEKGVAVMANTSTTVHGTWARLRSRWWKPGGDLHTYLLSQVSQDLYAGDDHFRWDGRYKGGAREKGAIDLQTWTAGKNVRRLDIVYAHSHGGNVAFDAAELGVGMCLLVLMSVPARKRKPEEWKTIWTNLSRAVSIRPKLDLVVLADRSHLRFPDEIRQLTVPRRWFGHGVVLQPQTWDDNDLPNEVKYERSLACR